MVDQGAGHHLGPKRLRKYSGTRVLTAVALIFIILGGMKLAAPLVVSFILAATVAIAVWPIPRFLAERGWPTTLRIVVAIVGVIGVLVSVGVVLSESIIEIQEDLPRLTEATESAKSDAAGWLAAHGLRHLAIQLRHVRIMAEISEIITTGMLEAMNMLGTLGLLLLVALFILLEANAAPPSAGASIPGYSSPWLQILKSIQRYLLLKTLISGITGITIGVFTYACGASSPVLWAVCAFVLNFIPFIGSVLAAIPPVIIVGLDQGWVMGWIVASGYLVINIVIGNVLEPRIFGRSMGLSPLIVLLSMVLWGWILGPVGALLSVPLTIMVRIGCEQTGDLKWLAKLMAPPHERRRLAGSAIIHADA